jgi:hypothetical protein
MTPPSARSARTSRNGGPGAGRGARSGETRQVTSQGRGVAKPLAALCAQVGMGTYSIAIRRWQADRTDDLHAHLDRAFTDLRLAANALK